MYIRRASGPPKMLTAVRLRPPKALTARPLVVILSNAKDLYQAERPRLAFCAPHAVILNEVKYLDLAGLNHGRPVK